MCGIAGCAGLARHDLPHGEAILAALAHRGPNGNGVMSPIPGSVLAHTRLAINDLSSAGAQPISSEDGQVVLVFNGEIYNYKDLRKKCEAAGHRFQSKMDGEVIVHLWEMEGPGAFALLNGIFALALVDLHTGDFVLARDPLGVKPLFYVENSGRIWFASEVAALVALGAPVGSPDVVALAQFLSFLWIPDPRTPFTQTRSLLPGHMLIWREGGAGKPERYSAPLVPVVDTRPVNIAAAIDELEWRFRDAAQRQLLSDVPVGLMASGGIDSGLLWEATDGSLKAAFTIEWPDVDSGGERLGSDAQGVRELNARFGTPVHAILGESISLGRLPPSGDLFADPAYELTRSIAARAREEGISVLLSGQGGDELFAGYRRHLAARWLPFARLGPAGALAARAIARTGAPSMKVEYISRLLMAAGAASPFEGYLGLSTYSTPKERATVLGCFEAEVTDSVVWERHLEVYESLPSELSFLRKTMTVDLSVYLPGLGLAYVDRAGMEFGVEIRVPWLDLDLVRWTLQLPDSCLTSGRVGKQLPRALARRKLGPAYAARSKRGFGAPASSLPKGSQGGRGFRQSRYLSFAVEVLRGHLGGLSVGLDGDSR